MIRLVGQVYKALLSNCFFFLAFICSGGGKLYTTQSSKLLVKVIQEYISLDFY